MVWAIVISATALLAFLIYASACIGSQVYVRTLCRRRTQEKVVALTYDDGPDPDMTPKVLEVLERHGAKATFFLVGSKVDAAPQTAKAIVEAGHTVGNHTWSHDWRHIFRMSEGHIRDIRDCNASIEAACGVKPRLYRPQVGVTTPHIGIAVRRCNMQGAGWSVRSYDTVSTDSREKVLERILKGIRPGAVILMHDRMPQADELTEALLSALEARGYSTTTLGGLFKIEEYEK